MIGALWTNSLALIIDAGHMLVDASGLLIALLAASLALRPPSPERTWGYRRAEVLAAGAQAAVLLAVGSYAFIEGVRRLLEPPDVTATGLLVFGVIGLLGNLISMMVLSSGRGANLNMRAAFLEVVNDALGSVAVIISAIVIALTGWTRIDALAGMLIAALIVPHVQGVHDLHASTIATGLPVLTAHVVLDDSCFHDGHSARMLGDLQECVAAHFDVSVEHSTFQLEPFDHAEREHATHT